MFASGPNWIWIASFAGPQEGHELSFAELVYQGLIPNSLLHAIPEESESVRGSRLSIAAPSLAASGERDGGVSAAAALAASVLQRLRHKGSEHNLREDAPEGAEGSLPRARLRNRPGMSSELDEWHRMSAPAMVLAAEPFPKEPVPGARLLDAAQLVRLAFAGTALAGRVH